EISPCSATLPDPCPLKGLTLDRSNSQAQGSNFKNNRNAQHNKQNQSNQPAQSSQSFVSRNSHQQSNVPPMGRGSISQSIIKATNTET
ncbi:hypothetical protein P3S38_28930, partial [Enterobacter hormaechei]|uniref:hypothetical protein n=1 Tax=Enterobacter hormaechei TaxID=158836 RepID=UPI0023E37BE2